MRPAHYVVAAVLAIAVGGLVVLLLAWLTSGPVGGGKPHLALALLAPMIVAANFGYSKSVGLLASFFIYAGFCFGGLVLYMRRE
jgi:uncharacterized membrane protein